MTKKNEIILYQTDDLPEHIEVRLNKDTVWLTLNQIAQLFNRDKSVISRHLRNVYKEGELSRAATVAKNATVQLEAGREVTREIDYYNLDAIISVGYRVNSIRGTQFRNWANQVLKDHLLKRYSIAKRLDRIEDNVHGLIGRMDQIEVQISADLSPEQGVFFQGQIYDAYAFTADLIRKVKKSIILIDNYVDDTVFTLLSKRSQTVSDTHDRFLILDENELYLFGVSFRDMGKKPVVSEAESWFAFSKMGG